MDRLEELYDMAHKNNIQVINSHFSNIKKAACLYDDDYKTIALDKPRIESSAEEKVLLAEELGHYETGSLYLIEATYNTGLARSNREKGEAKAKRWAVKEILSPEDIQKAIKSGCCNFYEVAEYCEVPFDFLQKAVNIYQEKGIMFKYPSCDDW